MVSFLICSNTANLDFFNEIKNKIHPKNTSTYISLVISVNRRPASQLPLSAKCKKIGEATTCRDLSDYYIILQMQAGLSAAFATALLLALCSLGTTACLFEAGHPTALLSWLAGIGKELFTYLLLIDYATENPCLNDSDQ